MTDYVRNDLLDAIADGLRNGNFFLMTAGHAVEDDPCYGMDDNAGYEREQEEFADSVLQEVREAIRRLKEPIPPCKHQWQQVYNHGYRDTIVFCTECRKRSVEEEERIGALNACIGVGI
jgi:hypothetical protein